MISSSLYWCTPKSSREQPIWDTAGDHSGPCTLSASSSGSLDIPSADVHSREHPQPAYFHHKLLKGISFHTLIPPSLSTHLQLVPFQALCSTFSIVALSFCRLTVRQTSKLCLGRMNFPSAFQRTHNGHSLLKGYVHSHEGSQTILQTRWDPALGLSDDVYLPHSNPLALWWIKSQS